MNMKRMISLALMALLLCLPVWAMAENLHVNGRVEFSNQELLAARDSDGTVYINVDEPGSTIVLNDVVLPNTQIFIDVPENDEDTTENDDVEVGPIRIELIGDNSITCNVPGAAALHSVNPLVFVGEGSLTCTNESFVAIFVEGGLTIQSGKLTAAGGITGVMIQGEFSFLGDELTVEGDDDYGGIVYEVPGGTPTQSFALPECSSVPAGYTFKAWSVNGKEMQPGDIVDTASSARVSVKPVLEKIPELPKTGDDSNVILWSALAFASVIGMMMLVRRRKNA